MSRKDYELIARIIRDLVWDEFGRITQESIANQFGEEISIADNNPRFDKRRFVEACLKQPKITQKHGGYKRANA